MMKAIDEIRNLQAKLNSGDLPPNEPIFYLRAQDSTASTFVRAWAENARDYGTPEHKCIEAEVLADAMDDWPTKQIPGRPETRTEKGQAAQ